MPLIKSHNAPPGMQAFSMRDVEEQARAILQNARRSAERLLADAQAEGEQIKQQAALEGRMEGHGEGLQAGLEEGRAAGRDEALAQHNADLTAAVNALNEAMSQLDASRQDLAAHGLEDVVQLAVAIARRITKRQSALDPLVLVENLRESMRLVSHTSDVRVAVHPSQLATLNEALPKLGLEFPQLSHASVIEDESLLPGGCRVLTRGGEINADLDAQLDRVVADLLPSAASQEA